MEDLVSLAGSSVGWTAGAGVEAGFGFGWTARVEYLYISTGNIIGTAPVPPAIGGGSINETAQLKDSIFRFGINYKFGGPVTGRY